jgi:hypothetical protein
MESVETTYYTTQHVAGQAGDPQSALAVPANQTETHQDVIPTSMN